MFSVPPTETSKAYRLAIASLLALSALALGVTVWVMADFLREQEIVQELIELLPPEADPAAKELAGELKWQFQLSILVLLNLVVTASAVVLLARANQSSKNSLREFRAQASDILGCMDQGLITTDLTGTVTSINQRGIEMLALKGEYVGRLLKDISNTIPLDDFRKTTRSSRQAESVQDFRRSSNGSIRVLQAFCQKLRNHAQADIGNILQLRDVTERVLMDERLRRMERYMGLGSLAAGLHHEIRNPLAALSLHVQLLDEEIADADASDDIHQMLGVIKTEVARVGGVLENFRDFASLGRLNMANVDLAKLIGRQVKLIAPQAKQRQIEVRVELEDSLRPIRADRVRIEQVLLNLLVNAMEAMPDGGKLTVRASRIEVADEGDTVHIQVIDSGPGIPENIRQRIFDPYFTTKSEGTGMGLALCDKIMRQHSGRLEFHCSHTETVFEMTLPAESGPSGDEQSDESGIDPTRQHDAYKPETAVRFSSVAFQSVAGLPLAPEESQQNP